MAEIITAARPYAQAAFEVAQKQSDLKGWSEMLREISGVVNDTELSGLVKNPGMHNAQVESVLLALIGKDANQNQQNFIRLLVENRRLLMLAEISTIFDALKAEAEKTINVDVDSAFELSPTQQEKLAATLTVRLGREIKLQCQVDKNLLGGVVIRAGDKVIDGSAIARLSELSTALA